MKEKVLSFELAENYNLTLNVLFMKISLAFHKSLLMACLPLMFIIFSACNKSKTPDKRNSLSSNLTAKSNHTAGIKTNLQGVSPEFNCTGYILGVDRRNGNDFLILDTVQWFNGVESKKAFREDNKQKGLKIIRFTDAYYIRNLKIDSLNLKVSNKAEIIMQTLSHDSTGNYKFNEKIEAQMFLELLSQKGSDRFRNKIYDLKISASEIVSVKERYIP